MIIDTSRSGHSPLALASALLAGAALTYVLPYLVPVTPTLSESYLVGFSNRASVLFFILFAAAFAWWTRGFQLNSPSNAAQPQAGKPSKSLLWVVLLAFCSVTLAEWALMRSHPAMNEAPYFFDRLHHLVAGQTPYLQFEFAYGPFLLYFPVFLARVLHLPVADGYYASWVIGYAVGTLLIYGCVCMLPAPAARKNEIFLLLTSTWWAGPLSFGENYTPVRYFLGPFLCLLLAYHITSKTPTLRVALELLLGEAAILLISPEQGIAFCGATVLFLLLPCLRRRPDSRPLTLLLFTLGSAVLFWPAAHIGLLRTLHAMAQGGGNFPLLPAIPHVPLFALLLVCACVLVNTVRAGRDLGKVEYLILLGLFCLPAAFGRSDVGHFLVNSTPSFVAALAVVSYHPRLWRWFALPYLVLVILLPIPGVLSAARQSWRANRATVLSQNSSQYTASGFTQEHGASEQPPDLVPLAPFGIPFANSSTLSGTYAETGFYYGNDNVSLSSEIDQKIGELQSRPGRSLLLPRGFFCAFDLHRRALSHTLSTFYVPPARNHTEILEPLCSYIHLHYTQTHLPVNLRGYDRWDSLPPPPITP